MAYASGDFASCIYWATFSSFLLIFYTDVFGITGKAAGTILLWSRILDGVNDPLIGALADRTTTRWGKFRPYLLWMCVPFALAGVLCFTTPNFDVVGKLGWAWITYNVLMLLYTAINIPYNAMLGVITADSIERTSVASYKFFFAFGAGLFVKFTLPFLSRYLGAGGTDLQRGYQLTFLIYGVVAVACFLIAFRYTTERVTPPKDQKTSVKRDLLDLATNGPWLILLGVTVAYILCVGTRDTISAYYIKYYLGTREVTLPFLGARTYGYEAFVAVFLGFGAFGSLLGVLMTNWIVRLIGKKVAFIVLLTGFILFFAAYNFIRPDQILTIFGLQLIGSIIGGPICVLLWAMYADTADFGEWKRGRRATGLIFSASTMAQKFGWAVCGKAAGDMLTLTGFIANASAQTPETLAGMKRMMSTLPAGFGLLAIVIFLFFPLGERKMAQIAADLKLRRGAGAY